MTQQQDPELYDDSYDQQQSWDHPHQHETQKTPSFTATQIPAHITINHNHWTCAEEQTHMELPMPITSPPSARYLRYANPQWKNPQQMFGQTQNDYGKHSYTGPRWHQNHERHRPLTPRLTETGNRPKESSRGYNPSRYHYVSESYLRSLKENKITCSRTTQQRNVQVAVIRPIARVENSQAEKPSSSELVSIVCKDKDDSDAYMNNEFYSTDDDVIISEILDYKIVSSDMYCSNEGNENQYETDINSNCIEIKPDISALISKYNSNLSNINTNVPSPINLVKLSSEQEDIEADKTKSISDESKTNILPQIISNLFANQSFENYTIETEYTSKQNDINETLYVRHELSDFPLKANSTFDNIKPQYKEKAVEKVKPHIIHVECDTKIHQNNEEKLSEVSEALTFKSTIECRSHIKHSQVGNEIKNANVAEESIEMKPNSQSKSSESHTPQRIKENQNSFLEIPIQTLDTNSCNENSSTLNPDVLTSEMLRERLFRRFINSSELITPVENDIQDQNVITDHEKEFKSLMSDTLKMAGIIPKNSELSPKQDKKNISIKTEDKSYLMKSESSENVCLAEENNSGCLLDKTSNIYAKNITEDHSYIPKQMKAISKIENHTDSLNGELPFNLLDEKLLKTLSNANLFSNLDIQFLKDILTKIKTSSTVPIRDKMKNPKTDIDFDHSSLKNMSVTENSKVKYFKDDAIIKSEYLKNESDLCQKNLSHKKENLSTLVEEIDTSVILNLESVEECMMNSVSVVHLQSEVWEGNEMDKENIICMESMIKQEQCHTTEITPSHNFEATNPIHNISEMKPQINEICEKLVDNFKDPVCTLKESLTSEGNLIADDLKFVQMRNSSLSTSPSNNDHVSNDQDLDFLTIEHNLNKMFGMEEENIHNFFKDSCSNGNPKQHELMADNNYELLDKDIQSSTVVDLPKQIQRESESFLSKENKNLLEVSDKFSNHESRCFIEYSPSMIVTDNNDAISISSDEVGDGDDSMPEEENGDFQQHNDESKSVDDENRNADHDFERNNSGMKFSLDGKEFYSRNNDIDISSNMKNDEKDNYDFNNTSDNVFVPYEKFSGIEESKIRLDRSNDLAMAIITDDDLPDLCKESVNTEGASEICSEKITKLTDVFGMTSDIQKTESLKWKVSQKRIYNFSKDNLLSYQGTEASIVNLPKNNELNSLLGATLNSGNKPCENENSEFSLLDNYIKAEQCDANSFASKSQAKLKRLFDSDFSEVVPKKKVTVKKINLKCKPKNRKRNLNKVSAAFLSPKSISKALETSSYIIEEEVVDVCPLGHSLEKCFSTVNVNTDRISVFCQICKIMILMGNNT